MISRSSIELIQIKRVYLLAILQAINVIIFTLQVMKIINLNSFYLAICIVLYEGILAGLAYVNTFCIVGNTFVGNQRRAFATSVVSMADSLGIVAAGFVSLPVHDKLCQLYD